MPADRLHPDLREVVHRGPEPDRPGDVRRPALELVGDVVPFRRPQVHFSDHLSAAEQRLRRLEQLLLPVKTPIPVGPSILWPLKARKSASRAWTSIGRGGAAWAAATTQIAPTSCARFAISLTGLIVPRTLEQRLTVTIFVRSVRRSSYCSIRSVPSS